MSLIISEKRKCCREEWMNSKRNGYILQRMDTCQEATKKVKESCLVIREGAAEGGANDWGEVVTR